MNRLVIALIMGLIIFLVLPYLYIPSTIRQTLMALVPATPQAAQESLLNEARWHEWWPESTDENKAAIPGTFTYNGHEFKPGMKQFSSIEIISDHAGDSTQGLVTFFPYGKDSVRINWELRVKASLNPITRMQQNRNARKLQQDMSTILQGLSTYIGNPEHFYGIKVIQSKITDTVLVMTRSQFAQQPDMAAIYGMVGKLQHYATQSGASVTNPPMLHIRKLENGQLEAMVALPVSKELSSTSSIEAKRMFGGNVLVTEIKGGPATVANAFRKFETYVSDYHFTSPAIPFESLITNRIEETDTSKWVTKIYYPVF